jgi:hypothetical protein
MEKTIRKVRFADSFSWEEIPFDESKWEPRHEFPGEIFGIYSGTHISLKKEEKVQKIELVKDK